MLGLGLSEYFPYVIYAGCLVTTLLAVFYRPEVGLLFICPLLPLYALLHEVIRSDLPFAYNVLDILAVGMILGWMFRNERESDEGIGSKAPLTLPIVVLVVYTLLSMAIGSFSLGPADVLTDRMAHWKNYMIMPLMYLIAFYNLRERKWQYALFILIGIAFLAMDYKFRISFQWVQHTHYVEKSRLGGTLAFLGPNEWGSFHAIYTLFLVGLFLVDKDIRRRIVYAIVIAANTYSLMYSFSRGSYLGFLVGITFASLVRARKLLVLLLVFLVFWKSLVPLSVRERVEGTFVEEDERQDVVSFGGETVETAGRTEIWAEAISYAHKAPILGTGYNTFQMLTGVDTHNVYLKTLMEQGAIGLGIYLWFYVLALRSGWRMYRHGREEMARAVGFGFLCAVVGSMTVNFFGDRWTYLQLGGIYWVVWGLIDQENARMIADDEGKGERGVETVSRTTGDVLEG